MYLVQLAVMISMMCCQVGLMNGQQGVHWEPVNFENKHVLSLQVELYRCLPCTMNSLIPENPRTSMSCESQIVILVLDGADTTESTFDIQVAAQRFCEYKAFSLGETIYFLVVHSSGDVTKLKDDASFIHYICTYFSNYTITTLGYGISGAIIKAASCKGSANDFVVDDMIFVGTPILEEHDNDFAIHKFRRLYNFYSTGDWDQVIANSRISTIFQQNSKRKVAMPISSLGVTNALVNTCKMYNIRTQLEGIEVSLDSLKKIFNQLPAIISLVNRYEYHTDLDLNIAHIMNGYDMQLAIRSEKKYQNLVGQKIFSEIMLSNDNKATFQRRYGRDISYKQPKLSYNGIASFCGSISRYCAGGNKL